MTLNGVMAIILHYFAAFGSYRGQLRTRNSPRDEIANVNFFYNDVLHAVQNAIDSCIHCATDQHRFTKFSEIEQFNGHYAIQSHRFGYPSKAHIRLPISV